MEAEDEDEEVNPYFMRSNFVWKNDPFDYTELSYVDAFHIQGLALKEKQLNKTNKKYVDRSKKMKDKLKK